MPATTPTVQVDKGRQSYRSPVGAASAASVPGATMAHPAIHHTGLTVASLERALAFWRDGLGMVEVFTQERVCH